MKPQRIINTTNTIYVYLSRPEAYQNFFKGGGKRMLFEQQRKTEKGGIDPIVPPCDTSDPD